MAHPEASTRAGARVVDPPATLDGDSRAAKRRLALAYAQDVLHSPAAGLGDHRHALLVVVHELEQVEGAVVNLAGIARARKVLEAARRPDRCGGSSRLVYATHTDGDGVVDCPACGCPRLTEAIRGCDRWRVVEEHEARAERPATRVGTILLSDPAEGRQ